MVNPKLLIVDDDPGIRTQLKWGLDEFDIITADSRDSAIEQFEEHCPPIVTLDLGLPPDADGTSEGYAALKAILEREPKTKVVVVSGSGEEMNAEKVKNEGAFEFFAKPVDLVQLEETIGRALKAFELS